MMRNFRMTPTISSALIALIVALWCTSASGTTVSALVRMKGHEQNKFTGLGIVVGLDGTGDTVEQATLAALPYRSLLESLGTRVGSIRELENADSFAIVQVTMTISDKGAREGDLFDATVTTLYNATSLKGGYLFFTPLRLPGPDSPTNGVWAIASGDLVVEGDNPRKAKLWQGAQMLVDHRTHVVSQAGIIELVLHNRYADHGIATTIADAINAEFEFEGYAAIARVRDAKNIEVHLPAADRAEPAAFINTMMRIPIDPSLLQGPPMVYVNRGTQTITVTGNVEISPSAISHPGLTLGMLTPAVGPDGLRPNDWASVDTTDGASRSSARLDDVLSAFRQLNVPLDDRIAILQSLEKAGVLHAELIIE
ncbi:MAG: flagellar basal body P-ring protein FlgI [Phycisphaerales bacterium]|nr:flagellar basal body P-ring protein FlgI [Phycisphaerales bacterium]